MSESAPSSPPISARIPVDRIAGPLPEGQGGHYPGLFHNRNFLLLWMAYVISALGDRIHFVIMLALLTQLKHKAEAGTQETAQLNVMMLLPFLVLGPLTGVLADRLPRRAIMVTADFVRVAIVLVARTLFLAVPAGLHNSVPGLGGGDVCGVAAAV